MTRFQDNIKKDRKNYKEEVEVGGAVAVRSVRKRCTFGSLATFTKGIRKTNWTLELPTRELLQMKWSELLQHFFQHNIQ